MQVIKYNISTCESGTGFVVVVVFAVPCGMWESYFPNKGSNPRPLRWKRGVSTTGLPAKSLGLVF